MTREIKPKASATAFGTCIMRAASYYEKEACYKSEDYIAPKLIPAYFGAMVKHSILRGVLKKVLFKVPGIYEYVIARTKFIDEIFIGSLDKVEQVLIFGAGFDSRAIRFMKELKNVQLFELDAPETQQAKITKLKEQNIDFPPNLKFIAIDFNKESLAEKLAEAGFQKDRVCLFLLEGLTYYLADEAIDSTLRLISDWGAQDSLLVFDYAAAEAVRQEISIAEHNVNKLHQSLNKAGEKVGFALEEKLTSFLEKYKFEVVEEAASASLANRYFAQPDFPLAAQKFSMVKAIKSA